VLPTAKADRDRPPYTQAALAESRDVTVATMRAREIRPSHG
jgi:hypothetical protein